MNWFRKLSQRKSASQVKSTKTTSVFKWWRKSTVGEDEGEAPLPLQNEVDVVPKTEIQVSRQTLDNISYTFGESSSGEANDTGKQPEKRSCENKHCCETEINTQPGEIIDKGDGEAIKNQKSIKTTFIDNLRAADLKEHMFDEIVCRLPSKVIKNVKNAEYIIHFDPYVDYGRMECPDSTYPSLIDYPSVRYGRYVELKGRKDRQYSETFDLFTKSDNIKTVFDKATVNYRLLSNIEKNIDESKHNLLKCRIYNRRYDEIRKRLGFENVGVWKSEDFNDDCKSTRMTDDTRTIKEFYRLTNENHILIHLEDISVQTGRSEEEQKPNTKKDFIDFLDRIFFKGKEITERHKKSGSCLKEIVGFFRKKSK